MVYQKSDHWFSQRIILWQKHFGRHHLPWQNKKDPYLIWLSEVMLQQTQVSTVIPYFLKFIQRFSNIHELAKAPLDEVLEYWSGLGYYSRARNLHRAANQICTHYQGEFPIQQLDRIKLPGIGRSTAGAIGVFAFNQKLPILDGNVKRVFTRFFAIQDDPYIKSVENELWNKAEELLPEKSIVGYTQGLMDLGASVCTINKPRCDVCPLQDNCLAYSQNQVSLYPVRKKKKPPKFIKLNVFVLSFQSKYWLIKRTQGIWKGLWSFPMVEELENEKEWLTYHDMEAQLVCSYPKLLHQLTHRSIQLSMKKWQLNRVEDNLFLSQGIWVSYEEIKDMAISTAMKKMLELIT